MTKYGKILFELGDGCFAHQIPSDPTIVYFRRRSGPVLFRITLLEEHQTQYIIENFFSVWNTAYYEGVSDSYEQGQEDIRNSIKEALGLE